ncbi:Csu type fimbrial protein [Brevundimonas lenta]|uniref:Spore coat protein U-like protein n=1 Tax=Brevundimonas lenta TaxID=424796 RepID=A0A7W6NRA2_9CAUL|nr:spore coat U domain-containing protein [Brevundimonas lenta]MBB4083960.1 spore coat protein U-like protein [Brevundimonas lenta]
MRALITLSLLFASSAAAAQTPPPAATCNIRSPGLNFGIYSALDQAPGTALGRIDLSCLPLVATAGVRVSLSSGSSAQPLDRAMTNGDATLRYNLFADPGHHLVLGDGSNGTVEPVQLTRGLGRASFRVYGVIWPRQAVPAGDYSDTVRIDVEF